MKKLTDEDINIERIKLDLENETEDCLKNAIQSIISMLYELTKKNKQKVYTQPTDNPEDIIVGLHKQGVISDKIFQDYRDGKIVGDAYLNNIKLRSAENPKDIITALYKQRLISYEDYRSCKGDCAKCKHSNKPNEDVVAPTYDKVTEGYDVPIAKLRTAENPDGYDAKDTKE